MEYWILFILLQFIPLVGFLYFYINRKFSYWSSRGVSGPKPSLLSFGNVIQINGNPPPTIELELQRKYGTVYGNFQGFNPTLTITDADLIKRILVKDFPSWVNRRKLNGYHEMNNNHQFNAEGNQWKRLRTITGKTFTSGKLRSMYDIMDRCIDRLVDELEVIASTGGILNTKEVVAAFTIDVIASTNFATETKAGRVKGSSPTKPSPFVKNAIDMFNIENPLAVLSFLSMPRWFNDLIGVKLPISPKPFEFFVDLTTEVLKQRKSGGSTGRKGDLVQLLIESEAYDAEIEDEGNYDQLTASGGFEETTETKSNGTSNGGGNRTKSKLSDRDIIAQSVLFLIAGFETTQATISNIFYELAVNPDIQERLRAEITEAVDGLPVGGDAYNEAVMTKLPYLEAAIKEALRLYPPVVRLERRLVDEQYVLPTAQGPLTLKKDQLVEISTVAVHYNEEYYPQPELFNPERFMPENKNLLVPYTYLPFGAGPRNCVGMRFAYQEIKLAITRVLTHFRISRAPTTPDKPQFSAYKPVLFVKPFQVKVEKL